MKPPGRASIVLALSLLTLQSSPHAAAQPDSFRWKSTAPLIAPRADAAGYYGLKDPSVVHAGGKYHVFMTTAGEHGWGLATTSFTDWRQAGAAPIVTLDKSGIGPGYRAAPQVFYFAPQQLWYLVYQGGDPMYSTTRTLDDPLSWSAPKPFFKTVPAIVKARTGQPEWLDFWTICDDRKCYLFFTDDQGSFFRAETALADFPNGFNEPVVAMKGASRGDMFEASNTYKVAGTGTYVTLVEAMGPKGRYFRAWKSAALDGRWEPLTSAPMNLFAGADNVTYDGTAWSEGVSHGEMIRATNDQTLTIDPCRPLQFLYQGLAQAGRVDDYIKLPYRLALLTATGRNPISAMCRK